MFNDGSIRDSWQQDQNQESATKCNFSGRKITIASSVIALPTAAIAFHFTIHISQAAAWTLDIDDLQYDACLQHDVKILSLWFASFKLSLNVDKSNIINVSFSNSYSFEILYNSTIRIALTTFAAVKVLHKLLKFVWKNIKMLGPIRLFQINR